jgi:hypothetical protein
MTLSCNNSVITNRHITITILFLRNLEQRQELPSDGRSPPCPCGSLLSLPSTKVRPNGVQPMEQSDDMNPWPVFRRSGFHSVCFIRMRASNHSATALSPSDLLPFIQTHESHALHYRMQLFGVFPRCCESEERTSAFVSISSSSKGECKTKTAEPGRPELYNCLQAIRVLLFATEVLHACI